MKIAAYEALSRCEYDAPQKLHEFNFYFAI